ncbi:MAG: signal recognition particle-docking protein FtsY [Candidatus Dadabacteria bacterium]|nr:signal recognition particle-docking protein FtsY [Candidatus Dadabacteria bacterium]
MNTAILAILPFLAGGLAVAVALLIALKKSPAADRQTPEASPAAGQPPADTQTPAEEQTPPPPADTLREGLKKSRSGILAGLADIISGGGGMDERMWESFEETLVLADTGAETAAEIRKRVEKRLSGEDLADGAKIKNALMDEVREMLQKASPDRPETGGLKVIMMVGVNGTGKTTTAGKLSALFCGRGRKVMLAAADTFRAAASEQLEKWARESGSEFIGGGKEAAPATVAFDAVKAAGTKNCDILIIDTAGRLHTKTNLMDELAAVKKAVGKAQSGAPHEVILVLDATTGQNAIRQTEMFDKTAGVTGIVLAKIDGTAKGGIAVAIARRFEIPVLYVGTGEKPGDIAEFNPESFVSSLFEEGD